MGCLRDCTTGFAKYILFFFNLIILVCAVVLIAIGVKYKVNNPGLDVMSVSSYAIAVGVIIALIAFFGCCGAIKENSCMLSTYAGILLAVFIIQIVLGILAFVAIRNDDLQLDNEVQKYLKKLYDKYNTDQDSADTINELQQALECCGLNGPKGTEVLNGTSGLVIFSCCDDYPNGECQSTDAYTSGCTDKLTDFINTYVKVIGGVAIAFAIIELLCAIFAFCVRSSVARKREFV